MEFSKPVDVAHGNGIYLLQPSKGPKCRTALIQRDLGCVGSLGGDQILVALRIGRDLSSQCGEIRGLDDTDGSRLVVISNSRDGLEKDVSAEDERSKRLLCAGTERPNPWCAVAHRCRRDRLLANSELPHAEFSRADQRVSFDLCEQPRQSNLHTASSSNMEVGTGIRGSTSAVDPDGVSRCQFSGRAAIREPCEGKPLCGVGEAILALRFCLGRFFILVGVDDVKELASAG